MTRDVQYKENAAMPPEIIVAAVVDAGSLPATVEPRRDALVDYHTTEGGPHTETQPPAAPAAREVPIYRRCPLCYNGRRGIGRCYSSNGKTRYYRCSECAHTWSVKLLPAEVTQIESRRVDLMER